MRSPSIGDCVIAWIPIVSHLLPYAGVSGAEQLASRSDTSDRSACLETAVVILGAGVAGITAAQALSNQSISDFIILEYNDEIGGRVTHTAFGSGDQIHTVELGANWVQGIHTPGGPENPIWQLVKKYQLKNTYSNYSDILTYDETGAAEYSDLLDDFEEAYATLEQDAGYILKQNLQDRSARVGLRLSGWTPKEDMHKQAVEWWEMDWEYSYPPDQSSQEFTVVNYNTTFYQFSEENNYVFDSRGFNAFIKGEATTFLKADDPRLLLSTVVTNITYNHDSVTVSTSGETCVKASYAICTFSLGVLQNNVVDFYPALPQWKRDSIATFQMGTYTKIFLQFPHVFWPQDTQFFLYADPYTRGYYPVWQSLDTAGFLPGSGIIFATVVDEQPYRIERMSDDAVKAELMEVLYRMFGKANVPDPTACLIPRWTKVPWAYGSYSNWPPSTTLEMHQNLRANVGRVWFAGEATSAEYYGFLHGAWFEGREVAGKVAACVNKVHGKDCIVDASHEVLHGTTDEQEYDAANGWMVSSFQTIGDV